MEQLYEYNIQEKLLTAIKNQQEGLYYLIPSKTVAFVGYGNTINTETARKANVLEINVNNEGGVIVSEPNSLAIGFLSKNTQNKANEDFAIAFQKWLKVKGINIVIQENDLLVDGIYKVASFSSRRFGDILFSAFHISYNVDINIIKLLCKKPMKKIPKGLIEYGVSHIEIRNFFLTNKNIFDII